MKTNEILSSSGNLNPGELQDSLIKLVQDFGITWNEHETYVWAQSKAQDNAFPAFSNASDKFAWLKENPQVDWFAEFSKLLIPLFDQYITEKKRVYGVK